MPSNPAPPVVSSLATILLLSFVCGCDEAPDPDLDAFAEDDEGEYRIADPTPVPDDELLGMVTLTTWRGFCSGMVIAEDRVLTAAHCFCGESLVGGNVCGGDATVTFRRDPANPAADPTTLTGTSVTHPGYNPSWTEAQIEDDLAVIQLHGTVPAHVTPFEVATSNPPTGTSVMIVGSGVTGSDCDGALGVLNFDIAEIDGYEDGTDLMRFNDVVFCGGDSGGGVLDLAGRVIYGVNSNRPPTLSHGWVNKSIAVDEYREWIRDQSCSSVLWNRCDHKGPICECLSAEGDCDDDADCAGDRVCVHNVGATYGYSSGVDVCLPNLAPALNVEFVGCQSGSPRFVVDWNSSGAQSPDLYELDRRAGTGSYTSYYSGPDRGSRLYQGANGRSDTFRLRVCSGGTCSPTVSRSTGARNCSGGVGGLEPF